MRRVHFFGPLLAVLLAGTAHAAPLDLTHATLVTAADRTGPEAAAAALLVDEVAKRTGVSWGPGAPDAPRIVIGRVDQIARLLPHGLHWAPPQGARPAEGYTLRTLDDHGHALLVIAGNDSRGILYGVGHLLRTLDMRSGSTTLDQALNLSTSPRYPVRGHQIGYRFKNNTYDAWTLAQFEQQIRDLAVFGANAVQLIAPASDDDPVSPLFPAPALDTDIGIARILAKYGLDCDLFYPEMAKDYAAPGAVAAELAAFEDLVQHFPAIHALYVPGGDPGHTPPRLLFPLLAQEAAILRRYHPGAEVWVSGQGFDQATYEEFYALLAEKPAWLTGVFFGPQSRDPMPVQRARIPAIYPIQFYPDIGHALHAQFPVPNWDLAFALLEGREPINPRPQDETAIFRHLSPLTNGFVTYSEGVNDDVNKVLWTRLGWDPDTAPQDTLRDYARYFIGGDAADTLPPLIQGLEDNWRGPIRANAGIDATCQGFQRLEAADQRRNWRLESLLYRAHYDAYARARAVAEADREAQALTALAHAPATGSAAAMTAAAQALSAGDSAETLALRDRLFDLAGRLFQDVGLQLSVKLYGASGVERGANLDRIDTSLNDRVWLTRQFATIGALPTEAARQRRLAEIVDWAHPVPGSRYDDLGDPDNSPHLVRGTGFDQDPELYDTAIDGIADTTPDDGWRLSWVTYAETLYDRPITLRYQHLDPARRYRLRVTYAGEGYALPMRLVAGGGIEIHPARPRTQNPETVEFDIPAAAVKDGQLELAWTRPPGMGGSGRGHQVAEAWLIPQP